MPFGTWHDVRTVKALIRLHGCPSQGKTELQIRGVLRLKYIFSYFSKKTYVMSPHWNHISPNIGVKVVIWKIIPKLSLLPFLIWSTGKRLTGARSSTGPTLWAGPLNFFKEMCIP